MVSSHNEIYSDLTFENTSTIAQFIMEGFINSDYDQVVLLYNRFKNAATQTVMNEQFLPIETPKETVSSVGDYIFEPNQREIVENIIPKSLKTQLFKAILLNFCMEKLCFLGM